MNFKDQIVWITGASSGLGEAMATAFAGQGARLIISARRGDELRRVQKKCGLSNDQCLVLPMDMADHKNLKKKADEALHWAGHVDILVNNAGVSQRSLAMETSFEVEKNIMNINFFGTIELTRHVLVSMGARKSGQIVVVSSLMGKLGTPIRSSYAASKHALHGYFDCLRAEVYEHNISVTILCPGYIKTDISINALSPDGSKYGKMDANQEKGMSTDVFARKTLKAIAARKHEVYIGGLEKMGVYIKRISNRLINRIVRDRKGG